MSKPIAFEIYQAHVDKLEQRIKGLETDKELLDWIDKEIPNYKLIIREIEVEDVIVKGIRTVHPYSVDFVGSGENVREALGEAITIEETGWEEKGKGE